MSEEKKRVVILGGGHAGFRAAQRLLKRRRASDNLEIVVVSAETAEVYHGLMPQIVGGKIQARNLLVPLRNFLQGIVFYNHEVERIDIDQRKVYLDPAEERDLIEIPFDYLVIALGSITDLARFPGLQEHGLQTKTIGDVYHLHDHLLEMLERASVATDAVERKRLLTFLVAGAGYAGVEIGAEANDLLRQALRFYPTLRQEDLSISIVTSTNRILPAMPERMAHHASEYLERKGVKILLNTSIVSVNSGEAVFSNGERVGTRSVIVTVGIGPNPVVAALPFKKDRGRIVTDEFCRVPGQHRVYAVGDAAAVPLYKADGPCPASALYAFTQGKCAASNIIQEIRGKPLRQYKFHNFGEVAQLGNRFGLVQLFGVPLSGILASVLARVTFFVLIHSWRCRLGLLADWTNSLIFSPDINQMKIARTDLIVPLRFAAGQEIIRQGEPGSRFYIVNTGKVEVVRRNGTSETVLATLGPGKYFGEVALLQSSGRTATVRATEDTRVLSIARKDFTVLVQHLPMLEHAMAETTKAALAGASPNAQQ
jgi:NADH dehydrogenase